MDLPEVHHDVPPNSLNRLPDEVLHIILFSLPLSAIIQVSALSVRFNRLASDPALWRHYCLRDFRYWDQRHDIKLKRSEPARLTDWQALYQLRCGKNRSATALFEQILATQTGRKANIRAIIDHGCDVKEVLLQHTLLFNAKDDPLAREYFRKAVLGLMNRTLAIREWQRSLAGPPDSLERAFTAFKLFDTASLETDFEEEAMHFDELIRAFKKQHPDQHVQPTRARALSLLHFIRQSNVLWDRLGFRRINDERGNDYFEVITPHPAFVENEPVSMPLQTSRFIASPDPYLVVLEVVVFCVLAQRLGINAQPLNIVLRFRAVVYPPEGRDLDDRLLAAGRVGEPMYLDPRSTSDERPRAEMEKILRGYHHIVPAAARTLEPRPVPQFLAVAAIRAVLGSHDHWRQHTVAPQLWSAYWCRDQHSGLLDRHYAALWAAVMLCRPDDLYLGLTALEPNHVLSSLAAMLQTRFPEDAQLIEGRAVPLFGGSAPHHNMIRAMHHAADDVVPKPVHRRTGAVDGRVKYRVGQVFQHRRYHYLAVIIGWDAKCEMDEEWVQQMGVDSLDHGRRQSFYHAVVEDRSARYVAQENIIPVDHPNPPVGLMPWAGRYFKRWDAERCKFVSNVRDEYPDD